MAKENADRLPAGDGVQMLTLAQWKAVSEMMGYRFEVDADGTERMIRPDGTVVFTATKRNPITATLVNEWKKLDTK